MKAYIIPVLGIIRFCFGVALVAPLTPLSDAICQEIDHTKALVLPLGEIQLIRVDSGNAIVGRDVSGWEKIASALPGEGARLDEGPRTSIKVQKPFFLAKRKITAKHYCAFLNEQPVDDAKLYIVSNSFTNIRLDGEAYSPLEGTVDLPANGVTPAGATHFCEWLSESGRTVRLPLESEWMLAAQGPNGNGIEYVMSDRGNNWPYSVHKNGFVGFISAVGEWVTDDKTGKIVLKRCHRSSFERHYPVSSDMVDQSSGVYGIRVVVESTAVEVDAN